MDLKTPLSDITGIGSSYAKRLEKLELFTVSDFINHYPFRYDDFSKIGKIAQAKVGETVTFQGEIWSIKNTYTKSGKVITSAILNDASGSIEIVWFNQRWLSSTLKTGDKLQIAGKIDRFKGKICLVAPVWEKIAEYADSIHTGRLVPIYPETYGITSRWLRTKISKILPVALPKLVDPVPFFLREDMLPLPKALEQIHFPKSLEDAKAARERLSFDELFLIQLETLERRAAWQKKMTTEPIHTNQSKLSEFIKNLPFKLTSAQQRVILEIVQDLGKSQPMNRLLQGEVGSGKTVVAAAAIYLTCLNGSRAALMAPTEILAFQHFETLTKLLSPYKIDVGIYTGSRKAVSCQQSAISNVIVGTHALLSEKLPLENMGLIIIDEQQRFGVEQRSLLRAQARSPHFLTMTATPIPRTVALTLYGDLDLSIIDQLPPSRKIVRTHFVPSAKRIDAYKFIESHLKQGFQAYIITPLIEASETESSARAAKIEFERLKKDVFPNFRLGLLHGKLKSKEKEKAINDFRNHQIDILVSTSVVEVGVDIPNATIMVIEGAERFGLAQLHQLRGRVGRDKVQSYALLFTEMEDPGTVARIKNLERIYDGLKLAELDLKIRGGGDIFGVRQSGRWDLKIASLSDLKLIEKTREAAEKILFESPTLDKYPKLRGKLSNLAKIVMPD